MYSFCVKSWAHDVGSKFNAKVNVFPLKLLPSLPFVHFELCNLVGILNQQVILFPFLVSSFSSVFALSFFLCIIWRVVWLFLLFSTIYFAGINSIDCLQDFKRRIWGGAMRWSRWDILTRENSHELKYSLRALISHLCALLIRPYTYLRQKKTLVTTSLISLHIMAPL